MKRNNWIRGIVAVILAFVFMSCGQQVKGGTKKTVELSFWTFQDLHAQFMQKAVERWNTANPSQEIKLNSEVLPYDDMHNKLLVALQSGVGAPDIVDIEISKFANYLKGKIQLASLNDILNPEKDKFVQSRLNIYAKDGQYYGLDYHVGAEVIYYNTEILNAAGVDVDSIKTWSDFIKAGQKVVEKTGKPMCTLESTEHWSLYPLFSLAGSDILDKDGNVILSNETNVKVLKMLNDMVHKYKIAVPTPGGYHHSEEYYGFMNAGGAASVWMPLWYMGRFTDYMSDLKGKIAIRPIPTFDGSEYCYGIKSPYLSTGMGGTGTAVTLQSKNVELAKKFLYFAKGSKEGSIATWTELGFDPIRWDVWNEPIMNESNKFTEYFTNKNIFGMLFELKNGFNNTNVSEKYPELIDIIKRNVSYQVLVEGSRTPEEALREAAAQIK